MDKIKMLHMLEERADAYQASHASTYEMDIKIFRAYCAGRTAVQISLDIPCAESTVYRAIRRVKELLQKPEIIPFMDELKRHIANAPPSYGTWDAESVLDMLYVAFSDYNKIGPEKARHLFRELRLLLEHVPKMDSDHVFDIVCDLCNSYERSGFTEGLKLGVHLADELNP